MGEGEDESEIPPLGGGSLIWHWGATRDDLSMPGLSDWSHDSGQEPAGPHHHRPSHTRSRALGWQVHPGAHVKVGAASNLTPEMTAAAFLPACPGSRTHQGGPVPAGRKSSS